MGKAQSKKAKKLTKDDPLFYSKIASLGGQKVLKERGAKYFSDLAKLSHPRGNGNYHGGRPKKEPVRDGRG
jgi:hypothetical protein